MSQYMIFYASWIQVKQNLPRGEVFSALCYCIMDHERLFEGSLLHTSMY